MGRGCFRFEVLLKFRSGKLVVRTNSSLVVRLGDDLGMIQRDYKKIQKEVTDLTQNLVDPLNETKQMLHTIYLLLQYLSDWTTRRYRLHALPKDCGKI